MVVLEINKKRYFTQKNFIHKNMSKYEFSKKTSKVWERFLHLWCSFKFKKDKIDAPIKGQNLKKNKSTLQ